MRVLAAMSGGVDSAVAAARAVEAGHEVTGVHMALSRSASPLRTGSRGCCSIEDASDARRAADALGIGFYVWDLSQEFERDVVADFLTGYRDGRTPNPCVRCNEFIKFRTLLERATALGFDAVCTGHYARLAGGPGAAPASGVTLHRSACRAKDQSYVLAVMGREALGHALFPLGDVTDKAQVRAEAARRGLQVAGKPDSYDICFVSDGDTAGFLRERLGEAPGPILDETGAQVGEHRGTFGFTIGQRKGLRLPRAPRDGEPRYVTEIRPATRTVVVGPAALLERREVHGRDLIWLAEPRAAFACTAQLRAHGEAIEGRAEVSGLQVRVGLDHPVRGVAPGQSLVLYDGDQVIAQATLAA